MATVVCAHIDVPPEGVPYIVGTQAKVIEVVLDRLAYRVFVELGRGHHPSPPALCPRGLSVEPPENDQAEDYYRHALTLADALGMRPLRMSALVSPSISSAIKLTAR